MQINSFSYEWIRTGLALIERLKPTQKWPILPSGIITWGKRPQTKCMNKSIFRRCSSVVSRALTRAGQRNYRFGPILFQRILASQNLRITGNSFIWNCLSSVVLKCSRRKGGIFFLGDLLESWRTLPSLQDTVLLCRSLREERGRAYSVLALTLFTELQLLILN